MLAGSIVGNVGGAIARAPLRAAKRARRRHPRRRHFRATRQGGGGPDFAEGILRQLLAGAGLCGLSAPGVQVIFQAMNFTDYGFAPRAEVQQDVRLDAAAERRVVEQIARLRRRGFPVSDSNAYLRKLSGESAPLHLPRQEGGTTNRAQRRHLGLHERRRTDDQRAQSSACGLHRVPALSRLHWTQRVLQQVPRRRRHRGIAYPGRPPGGAVERRGNTWMRSVCSYPPTGQLHVSHPLNSVTAGEAFAELENR